MKLYVYSMAMFSSFKIKYPPPLTLVTHFHIFRINSLLVVYGIWVYIDVDARDHGSFKNLDDQQSCSKWMVLTAKAFSSSALFLFERL